MYISNHLSSSSKIRVYIVSCIGTYLKDKIYIFQSPEYLSKKLIKGTIFSDKNMSVWFGKNALQRDIGDL